MYKHFFNQSNFFQCSKTAPSMSVSEMINKYNVCTLFTSIDCQLILLVLTQRFFVVALLIFMTLVWVSHRPVERYPKGNGFMLWNIPESHSAAEFIFGGTYVENLIVTPKRCLYANFCLPAQQRNATQRRLNSSKDKPFFWSLHAFLVNK